VSSLEPAAYQEPGGDCEDRTADADDYLSGIFRYRVNDAGPIDRPGFVNSRLIFRQIKNHIMRNGLRLGRFSSRGFRGLDFRLPFRLRRRRWGRGSLDSCSLRRRPERYPGCDVSEP